MDSNQKQNNYDDILAEDMGFFYDDPLGWAMYAFDWDNDPAIQIVKMSPEYQERFGLQYGLDDWACEMLDAWGDHIKANPFDGKTPVMPFLQSVSSGHGIGKSCITAIIILYIMSTRPHCKGIVTASTSSQLQTKTWAEVGKWLKKCITNHWFIYTNGKGNMKISHIDNPQTWRCDAQTCKEENSESFAGQHAVNSTPFYIFDEASGIPDKIWEVAEGGMTDGEPVWYAFGNPTKNTGKFRECFRKQKHRWKNTTVDSRTVKITNKEKLNEWVEDYGEDSDFVKVRIRGIFPSQSVLQFIPEDIVSAAMKRETPIAQYNFSPVILTCDPSWSGDDPLVIGKRQGLKFEILDVIPKNDDDFLIAQKLAEYQDQFNAQCVFIDIGYGTGIFSAGKQMGRKWNLIGFGEKSSRKGILNKRAQMWCDIKDWLKEGGDIPSNDTELFYELTSPNTVYRHDGIIQLESKKDMKLRGIPSPNKADALALSFALPVIKTQVKRLNMLPTSNKW